MSARSEAWCKAIVAALPVVTTLLSRQGGNAISLPALTCATEFGKSFQPIMPMLRIRGDALQVTFTMGRLSRHVGRGHRSNGKGGGKPQLPRRQELGPRHRDQFPGREGLTGEMTSIIRTKGRGRGAASAPHAARDPAAMSPPFADWRRSVGEMIISTVPEKYGIFFERLASSVKNGSGVSRSPCERTE
jgi:hypothetical protein